MTHVLFVLMSPNCSAPVSTTHINFRHPPSTCYAYLPLSTVGVKLLLASPILLPFICLIHHTTSHHEAYHCFVHLHGCGGICLRSFLFQCVSLVVGRVNKRAMENVDFIIFSVINYIFTRRVKLLYFLDWT